VREGDRVVTVGTDGSHAELRAVPERFWWAVPSNLSIQEAACIPVAFDTADDALFEFGRLQPGETVLVHAGAGGVGVAAIQLAKQAGACVIATASRDDKLDRLAGLGLDHGINYVATDFVTEVRRLTDGRGADVIVESVGGRNLQDSLRCLAYRGLCVGQGVAETLGVLRRPPAAADLPGQQGRQLGSQREGLRVAGSLPEPRVAPRAAAQPGLGKHVEAFEPGVGVRPRAE